MKLRGLVLAALVLSILAGALYWSAHSKPAGAGTGPSVNTAQEIFKLNGAAITQLTFKKNGAPPVTLVKAKTGEWQITEPKPLAADQDPILQMLSTLPSMNFERVVDGRPTDLKQYGLDPPTVEVDVMAMGQKTQRLLMGDDTPLGGTAYAMLTGAPAVFTISSTNKTDLAKSLNDLRDKRLLPVDPGGILRVAFARGAQDVEFSRGKDGWQIEKPEGLRADTSAIDDFVNKLTSPAMDFANPNTHLDTHVANTHAGAASQDPAAGFAHATPIATAKVTTQSGTQVLQVRKDKDSYYAKSNAVDGIYKVNSDLGQAFDKNLNDFRSKELFAFGSNDPNKVEMHSGSKAYSFSLSGKDWWSNGKKMDAASVETLVSDLRGLTATKFVDSGFTKPVVELTVTSDGGKRVQTVSIAKSGSGYLAKSEQQPSLYQLDASAVDELEKAADAIAPAGASSEPVVVPGK
jgi:Domain of unknown function (DUF4340)